MEIRFQLNYRFQGPNAPFLHAADAGYFSSAGLTCTFLEGISSSRVTQPIVDGEADAGFGDVSSVMARALRSGHSEIICAMPIYARAPCCLAYRRPGPPLRLAELRGERLAGPQGDTSARLLPWLLEHNGLGGMPYELLTVSSEERDRLIARREVAAITCFDSTLFFSMRSRGYDTSDLRFLYFADHGLDIYSGALLVSRAAAAKRPGLVDTLSAIATRAWTECRADPALGVSAVLRRSPQSDPGIVRDHLVWVLEHQVFPSGLPALRFEPDSARMATTVECARRTAGIAAPVASEKLASEICSGPQIK